MDTLSLGLNTNYRSWQDRLAINALNTVKPLQNKKGQKNLGYPRKKAVFFLIKGLLFSRVPKIFFGPSYFEAALENLSFLCIYSQNILPTVAWDILLYNKWKKIWVSQRLFKALHRKLLMWKIWQQNVDYSFWIPEA